MSAISAGFGSATVHRSMPLPRQRRGLLALVMATAALLLTMLAPLTSPASAEWSAPRTVYVDETGQSLDQLFLDVWREGGKQDSYGYPITPEITLANGHVVQYFQYARFEYWPEGDAEGRQFHFGNIGAELRPVSVQRSVATWSSTGTKTTSPRSEESLRIAQAWLPATNADLAEDARFVEETSHIVAGHFRAFWEATGEAAYLGNPLTEEYTTAGKSFQVFERGQLTRDAAGEDVEMVPVGKVLADRYKLDQRPQAQGDLPSYSEDLFVAPPAPEPGVGGNYVAGAGEVWIDINLSSQYMVIYQGNNVIGETYVSTGRPGFDTPAGTFYINSKYESDDMEGVIGGEYYNVPAVPWTMYFTGEGHAIHGAYWHNNFGAVMSHGCVNMPVGMAEWLYGIAPVGTRVEIHY
jgi:hypothetical protein